MEFFYPVIWYQSRLETCCTCCWNIIFSEVVLVLFSPDRELGLFCSTLDLVTTLKKRMNWRRNKMGHEGTKILQAEGSKCSVKVPIYEYMENIESVPENPAVCWTFLCIVPKLLMNCYYPLHFRWLFHFSVMGSEFKKFRAVYLQYEVGERGNYKRSTDIFKAINCMNIEFALWSEEKRVRHQSGVHNELRKVNNTVSLSCVFKVQFATLGQVVSSR